MTKTFSTADKLTMAKHARCGNCLKRIKKQVRWKQTKVMELVADDGEVIHYHDRCACSIGGD